MPLAYSYQRFSNPSQRTGDSLRRQQSVRDAWLARNPDARFDESLTLVDAGVSSFRGRNLDPKHALGRFLQLVRDGRVPAGSYLLVENLDRLSRGDIDDAVQLLLSLTNAGVVVVQLQPDEVVFRKPVDMTKLLLMVVYFERANNESRTKSRRLKESWSRRRSVVRATGRPLSNSPPRWLRKNGDRYELVPEHAAVVRRMFDLADAGHGVKSVCGELAKAGVVGFGRTGRWSPRYVHSILTDRRAAGEYQPRDVGGRPDGEPIADYYPVAVPTDLFHRVQAAVRQRRVYRGSRSRHGVNLFAGLLYDAEDGDCYQFRWFRANPAKRERGRGKFVNSRHRRGVVPLKSFHVAPFEAGVLACLAELDPADVYPTTGDSDRRATLTAELDDVRDRLAKVEEQMVAGGGVAALARAAARLEARQRELEGLLEAALPPADPSADLAMAKGLATVTDDDRLRLRSALRRRLERIDCLFFHSGYRHLAVAQIRFRGGSATRTVVIRHQTAGAGGGWSRPEAVAPPTTLTAAELPADVDLRDEEDRRQLMPSLLRALEPAEWNRHFASLPATAAAATATPTTSPKRRSSKR